MTLDEIKTAHRADAIWATHSPLTRPIHQDRAKLIEWLDRALPTLRWAAGDRTMNNTKLDALLREIDGETR